MATANYRNLVTLVTGLAILACFSARPWGKAGEFVSELRCEMTYSEIKRYADNFHSLNFYDYPENPSLITIERGNTTIRLWQEKGLLVAYQITWKAFVTNWSSGLKHQLCSGEKFVNLQVVGPAEFGGFGVWLDETYVGDLSSQGTRSVDVPIGSRLLRVEKPGVGSWSYQLNYNEESGGYDRIVIVPAPDNKQP